MFRHSNWSPTCISPRDAEVQILHCTRKLETRWSKIEYLDSDVLWTHTNWTPITVPKHWLPEELKSLKNLQGNLRYCLGVQRVRWSLGVSLFSLEIYTTVSLAIVVSIKAHDQNDGMSSALYQYYNW